MAEVDGDPSLATAYPTNVIKEGEHIWPKYNFIMTKKMIPLPCGSQIQKKNMCVKRLVRN
jgi:hypothetical protein